MDPDQNNPHDFKLPQAPAQDETEHDEAAVAFARSKINSIFEQDSTASNSEAGLDSPAAQPQPAQIYKPDQLYQAETLLQDQTEPTAHHYAPDHQLASAPAAAGFESLNLPGKYHQTQQATQVNGPTSSRQDMIANFMANQNQNKKQQQSGHILRPLIKAALVSALVFLVYNAPIVMGQVYYYITPANAESAPIILSEGADVPVGPEPRVIISKLNIDAPVVYDETSYDETKVAEALKRGVLHYGTTALPGELGNAVYMGHSSNSPWDPGRYKTIFSILRRLEVNDTLVMHYEGKRYIYEVFDKDVVDPTDLSVLDQRVSEPIVTLITCDPPGVNWKRLVLKARQISPDPNKAQPTTGNTDAKPAGALPGSPDSLYDRVSDWLF